MLTNRSRIAGGVCLALSLGTIVNVFGLQGVRRQPLAAIADTFPAAPAAPVKSAETAAKPASAVTASAAKTGATDPVGQLLANADADLSVRTADAGRAATDLPAPDTKPPADAKLLAAIQRELAAHGYDPGRVNGVLGIVTRSAVMAFEFDQHFPLTGEPNEELMRRIVLGLSGNAEDPTLQTGAKAKRIIGGAQRLLLRLGYDPGPVNAQLNDDTRKALRRFEADAGMVPKGRVSGEVMTELARRAHARIEVTDEALSN